MCQVAVYLDEEKIMESVLLVEPVPEGVRLVKLFEPPLVVPAVIRQVDLMKNKLFLTSIGQQPAAEAPREATAEPSLQGEPKAP
jgi:predicted RNA-binding protein